MHASSVFSSVQPYLPVAIAVFEFTWGGSPPQLSSGACHILAAVTSLPLSNYTGEVASHPPFLASLFIYSSCGGALPHSPEVRASCPFCYVSFFSAACLLFSIFFFLFSLGWGQSVQGSMLICPREYCMPLICSRGGLQAG
jgi:hypothetical protein